MPDALYYADAETLLPCRPMSHFSRGLMIFVRLLSGGLFRS
jgi:hypothetical protein